MAKRPPVIDVPFEVVDTRPAPSSPARHPSPRPTVDDGRGYVAKVRAQGDALGDVAALLFGGNRDSNRMLARVCVVVVDGMSGRGPLASFVGKRR
jgi:hypothetical protein